MKNITEKVKNVSRIFTLKFIFLRLSWVLSLGSYLLNLYLDVPQVLFIEPLEGIQWGHPFQYESTIFTLEIVNPLGKIHYKKNNFKRDPY